MRDRVLALCDDPELEVTVVWIDILASDGAPGARRASFVFDDPRVAQFHDPRRVVGRAMAATIGLPALRDVARALAVELSAFDGVYHDDVLHGPPAAFDTVFFFDGDASWPQGEGVPKPTNWVTQLDPGVYVGVDPNHFRFGPALRARLEELTRTICGP